MKYKNFPQEFRNKISQGLDQELKNHSRAIAAFDADGTLWDIDMGESFFKWQINNCDLSDLPADPWKHYRDWKASGDPRPAYLWLAQINSGISLAQVREWAEQAVQSLEPLPIFEDQKKLIEWLLQNKVEVFVVTASVKWAVEPGAKRLGLDFEHVLGVATETKNHLVTKSQDGLITYKEGKAEALLQKTKQKPFLACGNTTGDLALLQSASQIAMAVGAAPQGHELFATEEKLRQKAIKQGWMIHQF